MYDIDCVLIAYLLLIDYLLIAYCYFHSPMLGALGRPQMSPRLLFDVVWVTHRAHVRAHQEIQTPSCVSFSSTSMWCFQKLWKTLKWYAKSWERTDTLKLPNFPKQSVCWLSALNCSKHEFQLFNIQYQLCFSLSLYIYIWS